MVQQIINGGSANAQAGPAAAKRSLLGLDWLNFLVAAMQMGFGPFLSVYLTAHFWNPEAIGVAFSIGTAAAIAAQVPAGAAVDAIPSKPLAAGVAVLAISIAAAAIALMPVPWVVMAALVLQTVASCMLTPAIAAITLALSHQEQFGERLGYNVRFAAIGTGVAAAVMGVVAHWLSERAVFVLAACLGSAALIALRAIHSDDITGAPSRTNHLSAVPHHKRTRRPHQIRYLWRDPRLQLCAGSMGLFQLGNAAILPLAASAIARTNGHLATLIVPIAIIIPQALAAALSPWFGRLADRLGRRRVALIGFAALPIRAALFATIDSPLLMLCYQVLDGISASVIGVLLPLVVADVTRRGGRFNLGMGIVGLAVGIGATLSNWIGGAIANHFGYVPAFAALGVAGLAAFLLIWFRMPNIIVPKE
ncbi:MAG: MFS transporter [Acetobacteraceae bacterium]|nr:MFS transporter [Acetobacteraceae bacterium]